MKVLGIDTTTKVLSAAIIDARGVVAGFDYSTSKRHSSNLVPTIDELLRKASLSLDEIEGFALSIGPGSFTGLRVAVTTMKGFAFATGKPVVGIPTLDVIAHNVLYSPYVIHSRRSNRTLQGAVRLRRSVSTLRQTSGFSPRLYEGLICPIMDARRSQVYACLYQAHYGKIKRLSDYLLLSIEDLLKRLRQPTLFLGDGVELYEKEILKREGRKVKFAPSALWFPKASIVAYLGRERLKRGESDDPFVLKPLYLYSRECMVRR